MSRGAAKFGSKLKELRIHLCQKGDSSQGVRDFINGQYVELKKANPKLPILVRECSGVSPKLWARYDLGKEESVSLEDLGPDDVLAKVNSLAFK